MPCAASTKLRQTPLGLGVGVLHPHSTASRAELHAQGQLRL